MALYVELKTKRRDEYMNFPLKHLEFNVITKKILDMHCKTVSELLSFGYKNFKYKILANKTDEERKFIMQDIEECLAAIGLRFEDSDFTVYDVKIERIGPAFTRIIREKFPKVKTLGEISIIGYDKLVDRIGKDTTRAIELSLDKYGIKVEYSHHVILKARKFPLPIIKELNSMDAAESVKDEQDSNQILKQQEILLKKQKSPVMSPVETQQHNEAVAKKISPKFYHTMLRDLPFKKHVLESINKYLYEYDVCETLNTSKKDLRVLIHENTRVFSAIKNYFESNGFIFKKDTRLMQESKRKRKMDSDSKVITPIKVKPAKMHIQKLPENNLTNEPNENFDVEDFKRVIRENILNKGIGFLINIDEIYFAADSIGFSIIDSEVYDFFDNLIKTQIEPIKDDEAKAKAKKRIITETEIYDKIVVNKQRTLKKSEQDDSTKLTGSFAKQKISSLLAKFYRNENASAIINGVRVKKYNPFSKVQFDELSDDGIDQGLNLY